MCLVAHPLSGPLQVGLYPWTLGGRSFASRPQPPSVQEEATLSRKLPPTVPA